MNPTLHNLSCFSDDELVALLQCITLQAPAVNPYMASVPAFNRALAANAIKTNIDTFCGKKLQVDMRNLSRVDSYWYDLMVSEGAFGRAIDTVLFTKWAIESVANAKPNQRRWHKYKQHTRKPRVIVDEFDDFDFDGIEYPSNRSHRDLDDDQCPMLCRHDGRVTWIDNDGAEV
jgi:hypothetical protein